MIKMINIYKRGLVAMSIIVAAHSLQAQQKMSLEACREQAVAYNKELKKASIQIQDAQAAYKLAKKAYLPMIDASLNAIYMPNLDMNINIPGGFLPTANSLAEAERGEFSGESNVYSPGMSMKQDQLKMIYGGLTLTQPIYAGGKINAINAQAKLGTEMQAQNYQLTYAQVIEQTDEAYWNVIAVREAVDLSRAYLRMLTELEEQMTDMYKIGLTPASEKLKVSVQKNQAELNLMRAENGLKIATIYLNQTIGLNLQNQTIASDSLNLNVEMLNNDNGIAQGLSNRQELKLLNNQIKLSEYDKKIEMAEYMPQIGVSVSYNYSYIQDLSENSDPSTNIMGQISVPVFHWGERKQKKARAEFKTQIAQNEYEHVSELLSLEISQKSLELEEAFKAIQIAKKSVSQANESLEETKASFEAGLNTTTDLLNSQAEWQNAKYQLIVALKDYEVKKTGWAKATGQLVHEK